MFWHRVSAFILRNRVFLLVTVVLGTIFMAIRSGQARLSYEPADLLPVSDPDFESYESFRRQYGEDGNGMVIGVETAEMYSLETFRGWYALHQEIRRIGGVREVVSNAGLFGIVRDDSLLRLRFEPLLTRPPTTQAEVDSLRGAIGRLPFYQGFISGENGRTHLMAITFDPDRPDTPERFGLVRIIRERAKAFESRYGIPVHESGMTYIRTEFTARVSREMGLILSLAAGVASLTLLLFFRSPVVLIGALPVVGAGVVWSLGYMALLGYKITLLTGLIPSLILLTGVSNCLILIHQYQEEFGRSGHKLRALGEAARKAGETTFFTSLTISVGFFGFLFTGSPLLTEFGLVTALGVMTTYLICLILLPIVFSYLPSPTDHRQNHLNGRCIRRFPEWADGRVHRRRKSMYALAGLAVVVAVVGMTRITAVGYFTDDLPDNDPIAADLKWFEKNFRGFIPFEVSIDTRQPGRVLTPQVLNKIRLIQREFEKYPEFTRPLSVVEALKFIYQGYRGGDPNDYVLPTALDWGKLAVFTPQGIGKEDRFRGLLDSTRRYTRISFRMRDVGSVRTARLVQELEPKIDSIFNFDRETGRRLSNGDIIDARLTGSSLVYARGREILPDYLRKSTACALVLMSVLMAVLLRDLRTILIAVPAAIVPLLFTAGLTGFAGIPLKPSTIPIFSLAFGLSASGTVCFITRYRDELRNRGGNVPQAVSDTIRQTGAGMVYTALLLSAGFALFTASAFRGTVALGMLVPIALLMGLLSNLILLPALLLSLNKRRKKELSV
ncbi:efflux RND transporter permease subunit [Larkinella soli]|uniref:efflux RND transporter permease subunit n=1 Tax=Larkinella soli TaxID=1770527 RepID=UPI000FFB5091|nr:MMPL family transporter [Larkinella soli]